MRNKKFLSTLIAVIMVFNMLPIFSFAANAQIDVKAEEIEIYQGTTKASVQIKATNNPGIALLNFNIGYDSEKMKLESVTAGNDVFASAEVTAGVIANNPYSYLAYTTAGNKTGNGLVLTLNFNINADCPADTYPITLSNASAGTIDEQTVNVNLTNGSIKVSKKSIAGVTFADKEYSYDGSEKQITVSGNLPSGATVDYTNNKGTDANQYKATAIVRASGYADLELNATMTIKPKALTVTGLSASNKAYDGTAVAKINGGALSGKVAGDDVSATFPTNGTFANVNVGSNVAISIPDIEITGSDKVNYTLTQPTGLKASITKAPLTIEAKNVSVKIGSPIPTFDSSSYEITSGVLYGIDKLEGTLATNCTSTAVAKNFEITKGTLTAGANYDINFVNGILSVIEKTPQTITVADIPEKSYGDLEFKLDVKADETSQLTSFAYESSDTNVAEVSSDGMVTIKSVGETQITVTEAGNAEYAVAKKELKLIVKPRSITITALDMDKKLVSINGILTDDEAKLELDFDNLKSTVTSSEKTGDGDVVSIRSAIIVSDFKLKGEKASNYIISNKSFETTITNATVEEDLSKDENVLIEAAPVDDKTVVVTDVSVTSASEIEKITIDITAISDTKANTVAIPKATLETIASVNSAAELEIILKDGSESNKNSKIVLNADAVTAVKTASASSGVLSFSIKKTPTEELESAQATKVNAVLAKTPMVYSLNIVDESDNSVASDFGSAGRAVVELHYNKPAGDGNIIVQHLDDLGNTTNIANPVYDAAKKIIKLSLKHFSEYLIYTEPVEAPEESVSGGGGGGGSYSCVVKFESNGGTKIKSLTVGRNKTITEPTQPTKEGYIFDGWYKDKTLITAYNFDSKVTNSFTLYAKWIEKAFDEDGDSAKPDDTTEPDDVVTDEAPTPFVDVKPDAWYYDAVAYVYKNGITSGVSDTEFAPLKKVTRAQFITMLCRAYSIPEMSGDNFDDCGNDWYTGYLAAAKQLGISNGVGDNKFAPAKEITREEMITLIYNYLKSISGVDETNFESSFADKDMISPWAKEAVDFASGKGYVNGKDNNIFDPQGTSVRAELAQIFFNIFAK